MRRVILTLTEAQSDFLRGAVRSYSEDMSIAGLLTRADERFATDILQQLNLPPKKIVVQPR